MRLDLIFFMAAITQSRCVDTLSTRPTSVFGKPIKSHEHAFPAQRSLRDGTEADAEDRFPTGFRYLFSKLGINRWNGYASLPSASRLEEETSENINNLVSNYNEKRGTKLLNEFKSLKEEYDDSRAIEKMAKIHLKEGKEFDSVTDMAVISMMDPVANNVAKYVLMKMTTRLASAKRLNEIALFHEFKLDDPASIRSFGISDTEKSLIDHPLFLAWLDFVINKNKQEHDRIAGIMDASFLSIDFDNLRKMWIASENSSAMKHKGVFHGAERAIVTMMSLQPEGLDPNHCFTFLKLDQLDETTLLRTDQFRFWDEWLKKTYPDSDDELVLKAMVENREGGDLSVVKLLQLARTDDSTMGRASALQDLQMKGWLKNPPEFFKGQTPTVDTVYDYLSQGNDIISTQMFNVWIKFAQIAMKDDKEKAVNAVFDALWHKIGEKMTVLLLNDVRGNKEESGFVVELWKTVFDTWTSANIFPNKMIYRLPIVASDPKSFDRNCFFLWVNYWDKHYKTGPNDKGKMAKFLIEDFNVDTVVLISLIETFKKRPIFNKLRERLQYGLLSHWNSLDPEKIFSALKLDSVSQSRIKIVGPDKFKLDKALGNRQINSENELKDYRLLENERLTMWVEYMKDRFGGESEKEIANVLATVYKAKNDIPNLMRMFDIYKDLSQTKVLAAELQLGQINRLIEEGEDIPSVMKMFGLDKGVDMILRKDNRDLNIVADFVKAYMDRLDNGAELMGAYQPIVYAFKTIYGDNLVLKTLHDSRFQLPITGVGT